VIGTETAGHGDADDLVFAEGIDGEGGGEGGVDAAGQAEHDGFEAALADVIAQAEDQGFKDGFDSGGGGFASGARFSREIDDQQVFLEIFGLGEDLAGWVEDEAVAVEDEFVVAADLIDIDQGFGKLADL